ncbi:MAG: STT3 domain-containing protein [archaeon]|nr:STT3 domain-containing protein [archaeon]
MSEDTDVFEEIDLKAILKNKSLQKYGYLILLASIFVVALWIRMMPARHGIFIGIDPYYLSRMAQYLVEHSFHLPSVDVMRYAPTGWDPHNEVMGIFYIPAVIYVLISRIIPVDFHTFAIIFPAVIGSLIVVPLFFIGKELHNKNTGLFAALFFAVSGSVIFRTSAGFFEKESIAGFLMLTGLYFFIRAIRKDSLVSGIVAGLSIATMATVWGGVQQILLGIVGYVFLVTFVNKQPKSLLKAYVPIVLIAVTYYGTGSSIAMMNYLALAILVLRVAVEKNGIVPRKGLPYFGPGIFLIGGILVFVGAIFSRKLAGLIMSTQRYMFYSKEVIESTVAENVDAHWGNFVDQFGAPYAEALLPQIKPLLTYAGVWVFAFAAIFVIMHKVYKEKDIFFMLGVFSGLVSIITYSLFMMSKMPGRTPDPSLQTYFVLSFMLTVILVARKSHLNALMLLLMYSSMLGFASKIRFSFILGPYIALLAGYFMSNFVRFVQKSKLMRDAKSLEERINIYSVGAGILIVFVLGVNIASGYVLANNLGPSFSPNWKGAMDFLKTETPEGSIILSWWDFGYWFQTAGERPTNLDGGNNMATRNRPTAQYFTGMMNESQQKFFLNKFNTDYILVDYSMIGKYAAMSKIANYGEKVDYFMEMKYSRKMDKDNLSVLIYSAGRYSLWLPFTQRGQLESNVVFLDQGRDVYVESLCYGNSLVPFGRPNENVLTGYCLMPFLRFGDRVDMSRAFFAKESVGVSVFSDLYFADGVGVPYVEKVFDNGEVKIFKVNLNKSSQDELDEWWKTHDAFDLMVKK